MAIINDIPTELIQKVSEDFDEGLAVLGGRCRTIAERSHVAPLLLEHRALYRKYDTFCKR